MAAPTTVELLWGIRQRPKRGPKPTLSLEAIVAEAIALADAEGMANLSMQRLAERLGFTKMSLYRYVPGKEQLTALMLDAALGTPPTGATQSGESSESWRLGLRTWGETIFERYLAHPWTIELTTGERAIGPNELAWMEAALTALRDTRLTGPERLDAIVLLNGHVRSLVQQTRPDPQAPEAVDRAEQVMEQVVAAMHVSGSDRYPEVVAAFAEEAAARSASASGDALSFGIERILDGLGVLIAARA